MRTPEIDPYAILGVPRNATAAEIRAAYRDLVAQYHPDRHQGNPLEGLAEAKMAEVNRAWEILSDRDRRAAYDRGAQLPPGRNGPFSVVPGGRRKGRTWVYLLGLVLLLPLLIRILVFLGRLVFRASSEGISALRGTPAALAAVAITLTIAILLLVRRRRRQRRI
jgi:curved DNA-binding protein CbpA